MIVGETRVDDGRHKVRKSQEQRQSREQHRYRGQGVPRGFADEKPSESNEEEEPPS